MSFVHRHVGLSQKTRYCSLRGTRRLKHVEVHLGIELRDWHSLVQTFYKKRPHYSDDNILVWKVNIFKYNNNSKLLNVIAFQYPNLVVVLVLVYTQNVSGRMRTYHTVLVRKLALYSVSYVFSRKQAKIMGVPVSPEPRAYICICGPHICARSTTPSKVHVVKLLRPPLCIVCQAYFESNLIAPRANETKAVVRCPIIEKTYR